MSEKAFLIDAVAQFLQSSEWLDAVNAFLETHFRKFLAVATRDDETKDVPDDAKRASAAVSGDRDNEDDGDAKSATQSYSLEQYETFLLFKDLVERLLEQVIADLGCSGDDLVSVLEESARLGSHASSERQFFIKTLLSFERYGAFHRKIGQFAAEKRASGAVLEETTEATAATSDESTQPEYSEWIVQLVIAQSILESKARGELGEAEESFVPWAQALVEMSEQSATDCQSSAAAGAEENSESSASDAKDSEPASPGDDRMRELERTLIRERLKVDLLVAQRIADANAQLKQQMLHLVAAEVDDQLQAEQHALSGTAEENELAGVFAQVGAIETRLKQVKAQCFAFTSVAQPEMDRMYLFLKEKVHYQQDLVAMETEIFDFVFTQIRETDAALVPLLLEWLLLESEGLRLQRQIQEQLKSARSNDDSDDGNAQWVQNWDDSSQTYYYVHSSTGESRWEAPLSGYVDVNGAFVAPSWDNYRDGEALAQMSDGVTAEASVADGGDSVDASNDGNEHKAEEKEQQNSAQTSLHEVASHLETTLEQHASGGDANQLLEFEGIMRRISQEHDDERRRLELLFQVEKARQKEELRKRKEKKRRERLAKKQRDKSDEKDSPGLDAPSTVADRAPSPSVLSPRAAPLATACARPPRAETKDSSGGVGHNDLSIMVPGHGRVDLTHLLSDSHAKRFYERKGLPALVQSTLPSTQALLNPSTLRYLTEKMIEKDPAKWSYVKQEEIVIDEMDADAK